MSTAKATAAVAGFGCIAGETRVYTENGLCPIRDIKESTRILSFDTRSNRLVLSPSGGAYIKGYDYLYNLKINKNEELRVSAHHHFLGKDGVYLSALRQHENVLPLSRVPLLPKTTQAVYRLMSQIDAPYCSKKDVDCLNRYAESARRYGQQLRKEVENDLVSSPSEVCAQGFDQFVCPSLNDNTDDLLKPKLGYNRHDLSTFLLCKHRSFFQTKTLSSFLADQNAKLSPEHICSCRQRWQQFLAKFVHRHSTEQYSSVCCSQLISSKKINLETILPVSVLEVNKKEFYYDLQVLNTNNYICENGLIHHNSGKTQGAMYRLFSSVIDYPGADFLYTAPTVPLIRDIFWAKLDDFLPEMGLKYTLNKTDGIVHVHGHGKIFCRSMDNPARLVGFEVLDAFADELDILSTEKALEVYRKIKARMRQKKYKKGKKHKKKHRKKNQLFVTTTPEGYKATYQLFKKDPIPDSHLVQMSTYSNPHLPDDYIDDLLNSYPPQLIEAYLNGKFVNLVAAPVWKSYDPVLNDAPAVVAIPNMDALLIGQDFNVGRGCATVYVQRNLPTTHPNNPTSEPLKILVGVGEVVDTYDTPDTIRALEEKFPQSVFKNRFVYPDASGTNRKSVNATTSDITLMKEAGYIIKKPNKNPPIKDRVAATNAAFYNSKGITRLYINREECPSTSEAFVQQVYDKNNLPEKGKGKGDDATDAATYPIQAIFPIKRRQFAARKLGGL